MRKRLSFLPARPFVAHPLVPFVNDPPQNVFRLRLAVQLAARCAPFLDEAVFDEYLVYLQHYFLCKVDVDIETINEYQTLLDNFCVNPPFKSYIEAENAVAALEAKAGNGVPRPFLHSSIYVYDQSQDTEGNEKAEQIEESLFAAEPTKQVDETELMLEKKYNERMKVGQTQISNHRVNLDNMIIPMDLQGGPRPHNKARFFVKGKNGVTVAEIDARMTEDQLEKQRLQRLQQSRETRRLKRKTILLNEAQDLELEDSVLPNTNDRVATGVAPRW